MFDGIRRAWSEARGEELRKEVVDALDRLRAGHPQVFSLCVIAFVQAVDHVETQYGSINNLSNKTRRDLAKAMARIGRESFHLNVGRGYGLFLASALLEASALPGDGAATALELVNSFRAEAQVYTDLAKADAVAEEGIRAAQLLGARTAREAAEMIAGRPLSDAEWSKVRAAWDRNWQPQTV